MAEIRNYTMNFSSDITCYRKLVCTEVPTRGDFVAAGS